MPRCNERLGPFQKVCCIRMKGHQGLHRARWEGLRGRYVTEWATDGGGSNGVRRNHLVLVSRPEFKKGQGDGRQIP